ncbi:hypothetical protein [Paenisporosarcina sp. NPDC076898]|uniref:hypothetical protein n=1 Tax=unclassified Paenisporosarcina TaxID=2642018 RepID=UPI003CFC1FB6
MDFYTHSSWYIFVIAIFLADFLNFFGLHNNGLKSGKIEVIFGIATWILIIASFLFEGWIGGFAIILIYFVFLVPVGSRLSYMIFKLFNPDADLLTYKLFKLKNNMKMEERKPMDFSINNMLKSSEETTRLLSSLKGNPNTNRLLHSIGEDESKIDEIYAGLLMSGAGKFVAFSVVCHPHILAEYINLKKQEAVSKLEIAWEFSRRLGR